MWETQSINQIFKVALRTKILAWQQCVDTACFSAGTDAANFGVLFQQLLYELHLG